MIMEIYYETHHAPAISTISNFNLNSILIFFFSISPLLPKCFFFKKSTKIKESGRFQKNLAQVKTVIAVFTPEISVIQRLNCKKEHKSTLLCYALELI